MIEKEIVTKVPIKLIIGATHICKLQVPIGLVEPLGFKAGDVNEKFSIILYSDNRLMIIKENRK